MKKISVFFLLVFISGCAVFSPPKKEDNSVNNKFAYITGDSTSYMVQDVESLIELAKSSMSINESIGALAYYENAYVQFMEIPLEKREELLARTDFKAYYENNLQQPYDLLKNTFSYFGSDTTSTDEVKLEIDEYIVADAQIEDTVKIEEEEGLEIPEEINRKVKLAIKYFTTTTRGRRVMNRWLQRTTRYEKLLKSILKEEGAPEDLFYISLIESGLNPRARSYASAVGPWQFIGATGRAYGLKSSFWYDDRSDFVKATHAAGRHLLDLYKSFGDWYFAMAGYNYSPGRLKRRIKRYNAKNFWEVKSLPRQTRNYIPSYLAVRHVAKNHQAYGFVVDSLPPFAFDTVKIHESIDLSIIAKMVDTTYKAIRDLNPAVKRWVTPPDVKEWVLNLPEGSRDKFIEEYKKIPESEKRHYIRHKVRSGQTLSHISYRYGVPIWLIKKYNKIRGTMIHLGRNLIIPVPANKKAYYASSKK
ncbi:MAG: transglycosylase SLT domain-containing protein, partial [Calditrichia bacterium]|nr:transglycosylase SLT domain-containing protein [Calditrichia bacterium]